MSMQTRAKRVGSEFVINGSKHFISSPVKPDFAILFAQTGVTRSARGERKLVTGFLVDAGIPGFAIERGPRCAAQRAYHTWQLTFDHCIWDGTSEIQRHIISRTLLREYGG